MLLAGGGVALDWSMQKPQRLIRAQYLTESIATEGMRPVEIISIAPKQTVSSATSYASYAQAMKHWISGVRDEKPDVPRLVVYPEDVGLITAFTGIRGDIARHARSITWAMASLIACYFPQILYYKRKFPQIPLPPGDLRLLWMALTDTMVRSFTGAFESIARQHCAYVVACLPVAPFRTVESASRRILLGDWQRPSNSPVFEATKPTIYNTAFIFDPAGRIVGKVHKVHLVAAEKSLLNLTPGNIQDVQAIPLEGIGRVGIVISKDAWMPDVLDKLAQDNAEILIQPDANDGIWATSPVLTNWQPDGWKPGNWVDVQKYPQFQYNVNPMMTGNLFNIPFDGQSSIVSKVRPGEGLKGYIGQEPDGGFPALASWVVNEPEAMPLLERRRLLHARSKLLAPGSGSPLENQYHAAVIHFKTSLGPSPGAAVLAPPLPLKSQTIAQIEHGSQWMPALALDSQGVIYIAFVAHYCRTSTVFVARSTDNGQSYGPAEAVDGVNSAQWGPAIAADDDGTLYVAWNDYRSENWEIRLAVSRNQGRDFGPSRAVAPKTRRPLASGVRLLAPAASELYVLWSDDRLSNAVSDIYLVKSHDQGQSFTSPLRVSDTPTYDVEGATYGVGYAWNPCLTGIGNGSLAVGWQDFRPQNITNRSTRRNEVRVAFSNDRGEHFTPGIPVFPDSNHEQYLPRIIAGGNTVYWAWINRTSSGSLELAVAQSQTDLKNVRTAYLPSKFTQGVLDFTMARSKQGVLFLSWVTSPGNLMIAHNGHGYFTIRRVDHIAPLKAQVPALIVGPDEKIILAWQAVSLHSSQIMTAIVPPF